MTIRNRMTRRHALKGLGYLTAGGVLGATGVLGRKPALARDTDDPRFLIVLTGSGGASLIDSFLAIRASESKNADTINAYPDEVVQSFEDTPLGSKTRYAS